MTNILSDIDIFKTIENYVSFDRIIIEIWDYSEYQTNLVITVQNGDVCKLDNHKSFSVISIDTHQENIQKLKDEGYRLKKVLSKKYKTTKIKSNLRY